MKKIDRRDFMKVLGIAGAACAMTMLTGCEDAPTANPMPGEGSTLLSDLKPMNGSVVWSNIVPEDSFGNTYSDSANYMVFRSYKCGWENLDTNMFIFTA